MQEGVVIATTKVFVKYIVIGTVQPSPGSRVYGKGVLLNKRDS
jgi:hypothetical protein